MPFTVAYTRSTSADAQPACPICGGRDKISKTVALAWLVALVALYLAATQTTILVTSWSIAGRLIALTLMWTFGFLSSIPLFWYLENLFGACPAEHQKLDIIVVGIILGFGCGLTTVVRSQNSEPSPSYT